MVEGRRERRSIRASKQEIGGGRGCGRDSGLDAWRWGGSKPTRVGMISQWETKHDETGRRRGGGDGDVCT